MMAIREPGGFPDGSSGPTNDPRQRLVKVEDEILRLERGLKERKESLPALKRQINTLYAPLLRLPSELLLEIALAAFPEHNADAWGSATPLLLGSICQTWRDIVWGTPRLWCTVPVKVRKSYHPFVPPLLKEWLSRSRQHPLSIHLDLAIPVDSEDAVMWKIMDTVAQCAERWQKAVLKIPYLFHEDSCLVPKIFPQLRVLHVVTNIIWGHQLQLRIFQHAPVLSQFSFNRYSPAGSPVTLGCLSTRRCLTLLQDHPNLVHCVLKPVASLNTRPPTHQTAVAPSLEYLDLEFTVESSVAISVFLDDLSAPSLRVFMLSTTEKTLPSCDNIVSFIKRSSCQLVQLGLFRVKITEARLVESLALLPSLEKLKLRVPTFGNQTIARLTRNPDEGSSMTFLPSLTSLSLRLGSKNVFDAATLAEMARSRWQLAAGEAGDDADNTPRRVFRMNEITVRGMRREGLAVPAMLAQFQNLKREGMDVDVKVS